MKKSILVPSTLFVLCLTNLAHAEVFYSVCAGDVCSSKVPACDAEPTDPDFWNKLALEVPAELSDMKECIKVCNKETVSGCFTPICGTSFLKAIVCSGVGPNCVDDGGWGGVDCCSADGGEGCYVMPDSPWFEGFLDICDPVTEEDDFVLFSCD